jgi:hypothetical protein
MGVKYGLPLYNGRPKTAFDSVKGHARWRPPTDGASSVFAWRSLSAKMHELADLVYGNAAHAVVAALIGEGHEGEGIA